MAILERREAIIKCDDCGKAYMPDWHDYNEAIEWATEDGWMITTVSVHCRYCYERSLGFPPAQSMPRAV